MKMKWQNQLKYYPLMTVTIFVAHYLSGFLEDMVVAGNMLGWVYLFIWYTAWLFIGDKLIRKVLTEN